MLVAPGRLGRVGSTQNKVIAWLLVWGFWRDAGRWVDSAAWSD
jgi:hypothetical protein